MPIDEWEAMKKLGSSQSQSWSFPNAPKSPSQDSHSGEEETGSKNELEASVDGNLWLNQCESMQEAKKREVAEVRAFKQ